MQWLVILVLLTSSEVGFPTGNKADHTSTSAITFGKWNSQIGLCRHWTPDAPIRTTTPIERSLGLSSYAEALEVAMTSWDLEKKPTRIKCLGNALLEVRVSEGGCISRNSSHSGPDD